MWMGDVDVPESLVDAHRSGELVLFVGAGASMGDPSNLPSFYGLTEEIARDAGVSMTLDGTPSGQAKPLDIVLGDVHDAGTVAVHERVAARIGDPASRPNRLHRAIVDLACGGPSLRIVTTNFDRHLTRALEERKITAPEFQAPAMPLGDDFSGIVYLHGTLGQEPRRLVLTDRDFGSAYMSEAWAARFLERMFSRFAVLFIGYSHNDLIVSYLARGLRRPVGRFALTDPGGAQWRRLGIDAVEYPNPDGSHDALVEAIEYWARWASMGLLDHRRKIADLVQPMSTPAAMKAAAGAPPLSPEEASYLGHALTDSTTAAFFADFARGESWLIWTAVQPEFERLFDLAADPSDSTRILAAWLAEHYVLDESLTEAALAVIRDRGGRFSWQLWYAIAQAIHSGASPRPAWLNPWLVLLVENAPEHGLDLLDYALHDSQLPADEAVALLLFDFLTEPRSVLERSFGGGRRSTAGIALRGHEHWLAQAWVTVFVPNLDGSGVEIVAIVDRHLRRAYHLLAANGAVRPGWDPLSFRRLTIAASTHNTQHAPIDTLVDAARDCLQTLLRKRHRMGAGLLESWAASGFALLQRLAIHGFAVRDDIDAATKLSWLRDQGWLFAVQLRTEVFALIAAAIADAPTDIADALVADALALLEGSDDRDYEVFNLLSWITRHAPTLASAQDAREQVTSRNPDYEEREHPELSSWIEVGFVADHPPTTAEDLHARVAANAADAVSYLRQFETADTRFGREPDWESTLNLVRKVVADWPTDGFALLDALTGDPSELQGAIIDGWAAATLDEAAAVAVLRRLKQARLASLVRPVARLLGEASAQNTTPTAWHGHTEGRDLAKLVWQELDDTDLSDDHQDWLTTAINEPAGWLAQFWLDALISDWREAGDSWNGLTTDLRVELDTLIAGAGSRSAIAQVIFSSRLHILSAADPTWCDATALPLLDWNDPARARRCWDGFLAWGRPGDHLLSAGLLDHYLAAAEHVEEFRNDLQSQLYAHLAMIALRSSIDPATWITKLTRALKPAGRAEWVDQVTSALGELDIAAVEAEWERWMHRFWRDRTQGIPTTLDKGEAAALAAWAAFLDQSIPEARTLVLAAAADLPEHSMLLDNLTEENISRAPTDFAAILAHVLHETTKPFYQRYQLRRAVETLKVQAGPPDVNPIIEQALRLDCADAADW